MIKSGGRDFHGGAYYFVRNEALNANEFFRNRDNLKRPQYRFNYPGYFVGGPVTIGKFNKNRDKLFFFFWSQEFLPRKYPTSLQRRTFPTAAERLGDFSDSRDQNGALIPIWDPLNNRTPFAGNRIPANRIDKNGQALMNIFPQPNAVDPARSGATIRPGRHAPDNLRFAAQRHRRFRSPGQYWRLPLTSSQKLYLGYGTSWVVCTDHPRVPRKHNQLGALRRDFRWGWPRHRGRLLRGGQSGFHARSRNGLADQL